MIYPFVHDPFLLTSSSLFCLIYIILPELMSHWNASTIDNLFVKSLMDITSDSTIHCLLKPHLIHQNKSLYTCLDITVKINIQWIMWIHEFKIQNFGRWPRIFDEFIKLRAITYQMVQSATLIILEKLQKGVNLFLLLGIWTKASYQVIKHESTHILSVGQVVKSDHNYNRRSVLSTLQSFIDASIWIWIFSSSRM